MPDKEKKARKPRRNLAEERKRLVIHARASIDVLDVLKELSAIAAQSEIGKPEYWDGQIAALKVVLRLLGEEVGS